MEYCLKVKRRKHFGIKQLKIIILTIKASLKCDQQAF